MDQNTAQAIAPEAASNIDLEKLKKRVRGAAWAAICIGYLYLLSVILDIIGLFSSFGVMSALENAPGAEGLAGLSSITLVLAIPPLLSSGIIAFILIMLGKRIIHIRKGVMWKSGDVIADPNIKQYLFCILTLFGLQLIVPIIASIGGVEYSILFVIVEALLFAYMLSGFIAVKKLVALPGFANATSTSTYKTGSKFWMAMVVGAVLLIYLPFAIQALFYQDRITELNAKLRATIQQ